MVKSSSKPMDITGKLNEMVGFAPDEEIELFEVCSCWCFLTFLSCLLLFIMLFNSFWGFITGNQV